MKICNICKEPKSSIDFSNAKRSRDGKAWSCKECDKARIKKYRCTTKSSLATRNTAYKKLYGITIQQYEELFTEQKGKCAICYSDVNDKIRSTLSVDHDHTTGRIRGLLCSKCNAGLGMFKDSPVLLQKAAEYLICKCKM